MGSHTKAIAAILILDDFVWFDNAACRSFYVSSVSLSFLPHFRFVVRSCQLSAKSPSCEDLLVGCCCCGAAKGGETDVLRKRQLILFQQNDRQAKPMKTIKKRLWTCTLFMNLTTNLGKVQNKTVRLVL